MYNTRAGVSYLTILMYNTGAGVSFRITKTNKSCLTRLMYCKKKSYLTMHQDAGEVHKPVRHVNAHRGGTGWWEAVIVVTASRWLKLGQLCTFFEIIENFHQEVSNSL